MSDQEKRESIPVADVEEVIVKGRRMVANFKSVSDKGVEAVGQLAYSTSATTYLYLEVLVEEIEKLLYDEVEETTSEGYDD